MRKTPFELASCPSGWFADNRLRPRRQRYFEVYQCRAPREVRDLNSNPYVTSRRGPSTSKRYGHHEPSRWRAGRRVVAPSAGARFGMTGQFGMAI